MSKNKKKQKETNVPPSPLPPILSVSEIKRIKSQKSQELEVDYDEDDFVKPLSPSRKRVAPSPSRSPLLKERKVDDTGSSF